MNRVASADRSADVLVVGPDEVSGYGVAASRLVAALIGAGLDVGWLPLSWHEPDRVYRPRPNAEPGIHPWMEPLRSRPSAPVILAQTIPEIWPQIRQLFPGVPLIGSTVWETDRLPRHWPALLEVPDLVAVPGPFCQAVFEQAHGTRPVTVLPHVATVPSEIRAAADSLLMPLLDRLEGRFVFYVIESWTERKQLDRTIEAYLTAFDRDDPVALVVKTNPKDRTDARPVAGTPQGTAWWRVAELVRAHPRAPEVVLLTRSISDVEVAELHRRGDCYVSLSHGEGWGLGPFDAAAWGNPAIVSGWGGVRDYLDEISAYFIDHRMIAVEPPPGQQSYTADQQWSDPSFDHAVARFREVAGDPAAARARGRRAHSQVRARFAPPVVAEVGRHLLTHPVLAALRPPLG